MRAEEIRRRFTDFFVQRDHVLAESSSLIPQDPTLLLTNAGMVQFKPYFLGDATPPHRRYTTVQKCVRTIDIDIIGTTARHATFFEMLGNFSIGDYFKEKAIPWAYELVTEGFGLPDDRLWFTVYETDDEAAEVWVRDVGVDPKRVVRGGKDNFWQMGVPGPCGPCSEIFYDRGPAFGAEGDPMTGGEDRYIEVWNLVFMQYVQDEPYHVVGDLPAKNIDTGLGLERLAAILQDVESTFLVDTVRPVLETAAGFSDKRYGDDLADDESLRILADHSRSATMLIADGVIPANEARGYVLRRLIRRAVRHAWRLGVREPIMPELVNSVVATLSGAYPNLAARHDFVADIALREEERFRRTLDSGLGLLEDSFSAGRIGGAEAFRLHDTFGFPIELTRELAEERGVDVDVEGFEAEMEAQRQRARAALRRGGDEETAVYRDLLDEVGETTFVGYTDEQARATVLAALREGERVERAEAGDTLDVVLDVTPFYAESGGQVGDTGRLVTETAELEVIDTTAPVPGLHRHRAHVVHGFLVAGEEAVATVDHHRRVHTRQNHTGTHILHWALREVLGDHVHQAGSYVGPDRLRFDFNHHAGVRAEELAGIEELANQQVIADLAVDTQVMARQEAQRIGALAFFGDRYGEQVRVVRVGPSLEFCGGTHVHHSGEIGPLTIVTEGSIASGTRRVEALSGTTAWRFLAAQRANADAAAGVLGVRPDELRERIEGLVARMKDLDKELARERQRQATASAAGLSDAAEQIGDARLVVQQLDGVEPGQLRPMALAMRDALGSAGVVILGTAQDGNGQLVAVVTPDLVSRGVHASDLLAEPAGLLGGGTGRAPELAQAGGRRGDRLSEALARARELARAALAS